jgi:23S rRNA (pseudouridine1915-N3)-methyltransferase
MEFVLLCTANTDSKEIKALCEVYEKRLNYYCRFRIEEITTPKILDTRKLSRKEGELILERIQTADTCILLDELGKEMNSEGFSVFIQKLLNSGAKRCFFVIGGPFGFSEAVRARADGKISLSQMTFTHQLIRLFFTEQLYRAFTILKNEPYHHNG